MPVAAVIAGGKARSFRLAFKSLRAGTSLGSTIKHLVLEPVPWITLLAFEPVHAVVGGSKVGSPRWETLKAQHIAAGDWVPEPALSAAYIFASIRKRPPLSPIPHHSCGAAEC